jgi:formate dehydrogenase maturation protein FdhE
MTEKASAEEHEGMNACPECGSSDLLTITMTVNEREISFTACHDCEAKWWNRDGQDVPLESVLDLASDE